MRTDFPRCRVHGTRALYCVVLAFVMGCGDDKTTLVIENEHEPESNADSDLDSASQEKLRGELEIKEVLTRPCRSRFWGGELDLDERDRPAEGLVTIPHGESKSFELAPGCHDFVVKRGSGKLSRARVILDVGESATWVPFQIDDHESWWCYTDEGCND